MLKYRSKRTKSSAGETSSARNAFILAALRCWSGVACTWTKRMRCLGGGPPVEDTARGRRCCVARPSIAKDANNQRPFRSGFHVSLYFWHPGPVVFPPSRAWSLPWFLRFANKVWEGIKNNMALCDLKRQEWARAVDTTTEILQRNNKNTKALYRRGVARIGQSKLREAREDLEAWDERPFNIFLLHSNFFVSCCP